jgi:glutaminase
MTGEGFISTGRLPPADQVQALVDEAYQRFSSDEHGHLSHVYPALRRVSPDLFGVSVVSAAGTVFTAGDTGAAITIMSVAKPFVFALLCQEFGADRMRDRVGVDATGLPFNSLSAIERSGRGRTNPMVNPGAIATTSMTPGRSPQAKWDFILDGLSRFAGRPLTLHDEVYASASASNHRNRAMASLLESLDGLGCPPGEALDLYTRQSSLTVTSTDLAVMGATLADGGVNPLSGEVVVDAGSCHATLAVMAIAGLYETSGRWLYDVGLPGKSGIGGGIVTVSPGKGGLGTVAPLLDPAGNSVKGQLTAAFLSQQLGLDLFTSQPAP